MALARIMVAPNGAHKTKADHPHLPITISEVVETAISCRKAGADGLHAHVRDKDGHHVLDAGLYRELLDECAQQLPGFPVQITTEAVGRYSPAEQIDVVREVKPKLVSVALREMHVCEDDELAFGFYKWAHEAAICVQHILYEPSELLRLKQLVTQCDISENGLQVLFVLGRYTQNQQSVPGDLDPFLSVLEQAFANEINVDWAVCAFGVKETDCLVHAAKCGGKVRVGFENNLLMQNGEIAKDNCERVREVVTSLV